MRQFTIIKRFSLAILLLTTVAFVTTSCQSQDDPVVTEEPQIQAELGGYGSCGSCPLPSTMSGTLPAQLYPSSDWMVNLANCFLEDPTEFGAKCQYRNPTQTQTETITVYLQFPTH